MKYTLAIAHRVCPALAKTASHYTDKFEMVKATTDSLAAALKGVSTHLLVILDGCDERYEQLFDETFGEGAVDAVDYERVSTPAIGNHPTYLKQFEWLDGQVNEAEFLYFSEDDYIYDHDAFRQMIEFCRVKGVDFVTPLDHPDRYSHFVAESVLSEIRVGTSRHWRTVGTSCCTFLVGRETFKRARRQIASYGYGASDGNLWHGLTKDAMFSFKYTIGMVVRYIFGHRGGPEHWGDFLVLTSWLYHKWRLFFYRRYRLWGPMPSLAIHLCVPSLPPFSETLLESKNFSIEARKASIE